MNTVEVNAVDLNDPDVFVAGVPHEYFRHLRQNDPIHWHEEPDGPGYWVVTRHADVLTVSQDPTTYSSWLGGTIVADLAQESLEQQRMMMLNMDPPQHTKLRRLVNKAFLPRQVNRLEAHVREISSEIIDNVIERGECDFVDDIAMEMPLAVIAEMMGVPKEDRRKVFDWSNRMIGSADAEYAPAPDDAANAAAEMFLYANELAAEKRATPGDDIVSTLLQAEVDGDRLSDLEFDLFFLLLAVAGNETTRNLLSHAMLGLFEHPDEWRKLLAQGSTSLYNVEEFLRWGTPVMVFRRTATTDATLAGQKIAAGDKVSIWYISANRDEAVFADPMRFDVTRSPNQHIAFGGGGPHFCLGAGLARLEIRVMFDEIIKRLPAIEQAGDPVRLRSNFINGIKHLPVRFPVGARASG